MRTLLLAVFTFSLLSSTNAFACSCMRWSNAQQAALREGTIVAKVETLDSLGEGRALVKVSEVLKGELTETELTVLGQDGLNCNGELILEKGQPWILLFRKYENTWHSVACGEAALPVTAENKVKWKLEGPETAELSPAEFRELIEYKIVPSVRGLSCALTLRRNLVGNIDDSPLEMDYFKSINSWDSQSLKYTEDFSSRGEKLARAELSVTTLKTGSGMYSFRTRFLDPFFSSTREAIRPVSMRDSYRADPLSFLKFTNLDGSEYKDGDEGPFLAHTVIADCGLSVGFPLVPVDQK